MLQAQPVLCGISKLLFEIEESPVKINERKKGGRKEIMDSRKFIEITDKK